ncbi:MAG TPA: ATPase, T2SS/T4P/T4SS family [Verrucomicrobiae bacterium]|jgi:type IV pilus assembly protein PilB|nr:ATPase, T2SS/T4P/T4SS family [Verrucomicrobiae bacterium]
MPGKENIYAELQNSLIKGNVAAPGDIHQALREHEETKEPLLDVLLRLGKCDERALVKVLSQEYAMTSVNPAIFVIEPELIKLIPAKIAEKYNALPITRLENTLTVALANPLNLKAIDELHSITGLRIKAAVAQYSVLKKYVQKYYFEAKPGEAPAAGGSEKNYSEELDDIVKAIEIEQDGPAVQTSDLMKEAFETPVIKLVNRLLIEGIKRHASDIFIEPWENHVRVRARVDGLLEEVIRPPKSLASAIVSRIKVMSNLDIAEHRVPQDGRIKVKAEKRQVDMRISILPTSFGEKVCLRILDTSSQSHDISKLGFNDREQQIIKDSAQRPHGMILVTGPTGSGKTTTLYSVLKYLDDPEVNITTVEDPVEYQMIGINQVNVRDTVGLTFPAALRSILRQDPDIILIGEIRDNDTLDIAVKAALTGHLVLSTLHTNDAASSVTRMMNMGLEPFLIASTVIMISAQRLVRRLCFKCRQPYEVDAETLKNLGLDPSKPHTFFQPKGCQRCRNSGYAGRTVITEILEMTPQVISMIAKAASSDDIKAQGREQGMTTLRECAVRKASEGETSLEEVYRVTAADQAKTGGKAA